MDPFDERSPLETVKPKNRDSRRDSGRAKCPARNMLPGSNSPSGRLVVTACRTRCAIWRADLIPRGGWGDLRARTTSGEKKRQCSTSIRQFCSKQTAAPRAVLADADKQNLGHSPTDVRVAEDHTVGLDSGEQWLLYHASRSQSVDAFRCASTSSCTFHWLLRLPGLLHGSR